MSFTFLHSKIMIIIIIIIIISYAYQLNAMRNYSL
jgi:hypothetical protein